MKARKRRAAAGRGVLIVVAGFLVGSATLRMGNDAGQALALVQSEVDVAPLSMAGDAGDCRQTPDLQRMLSALQDRETRLSEREKAIARRQQALDLADAELERKLARLVESEQRLRDTISLASTAAEGDIARLTKVYENMKPKQAAALFEEMTPEFAAGFLARMRPEAAAGIMANLSPGAAHGFSVVLAGRNADSPTE